MTKMTKNVLAALLLTAATMFPTESFAINKLTKVYLFGMATSFNDSTVYLTDIQQIDSAWIDSRTKFLYGRQDFSYQLAEHLRGGDKVRPTTIVIFAEKRSDIEKKYLKLKKRYTTPKKGHYTIKNIDASTFRFTHVTPDTPEATYSKEQLRNAIKQEKAALKQKQKEKTKAAKADQKAKQEAKKKAMEDAKQRAKELKNSRK